MYGVSSSFRNDNSKINEQGTLIVACMDCLQRRLLLSFTVLVQRTMYVVHVPAVTKVLHNVIPHT